MQADDLQVRQGQAMSEPIRVAELESLLTEHTADQIRHRYRDRLDEQGLAYLKEYERFEGRLAELPDQVLELSRPAPEFSRPRSKQSQGRKAKVIQLPVWSMPAGVAAAFLLFFAGWSLRPQATTDIEIPDQPSEVTRGGDRLSPDQEPLDQRLYQALMERGEFFFDLGTEAGYRRGKADFEQALAIRPDDRFALQYLVLTCDALGLDKKTNSYQKQLEAINTLD